MTTQLRIGFTNKFYTLWSVTTHSQIDNSGDFPRAENYESYEFVQNLSQDEDKAKKKAQQLGVTNLEVDTELYGRNTTAMYYDKQEKLYSTIPTSDLPFLLVGKYKDMYIRNIEDNDYLIWYCTRGPQNNRLVENVLIERGLMFLDPSTSERRVISKERYEGIMNESKLINDVRNRNNKITMTFNRNIDLVNDCRYKLDDNTWIFFKYEDVVERECNGFQYGVLKNKKTGKGLLIKNKTFELTLEVVVDERFEEDNEELRVVDYKQIK